MKFFKIAAATEDRPFHVADEGKGTNIPVDEADHIIPAGNTEHQTHAPESVLLQARSAPIHHLF
jgi:hypothetical protein